MSGARDHAIVLLTTLLDRFTPRSEWRHTDIAEIVDALIEAARAPESAHSRALADEQARDAAWWANRTNETPDPGRRGLPPQGAADDGDR